MLIPETKHGVAFCALQAYNPTQTIAHLRHKPFMSHTPGEKSLSLALTISFLLHTLLFILVSNMPKPVQKPPEAPIMVDLQDIPEPGKPVKRDNKEVKRQAESFQRTPQEMAPRGDSPREKQGEKLSAPPVPQRIKPQPEPADQEQEKSARESLFKPRKKESSDLASLYPNPGKLAKIEEGYRKKYQEDVKESDTKFLNVDDIQFGSFLRRFESAVYGVWRYPSEAVKLGIEGITPVKITFNRKGAIEKVEVLESSGSKILDDEVRRTLGLIGPVGSLPRSYDKDKFYLIAFFHYGISSGSLRGRLY